MQNSSCTEIVKLNSESVIILGDVFKYILESEHLYLLKTWF